jgi:hypothetical protein
MLSNPFARNLIRLLIVFVAHWPVSLLQRSVKWDNLDVVLPYRYLLGEMWGSGRIPLWNPYQQMGYPMYADLQSPTWYPETILIGLLGGYTNYTIQLLLIGYAFLGAVGFSRLARSYGMGRDWSFLAGVVYALSGFWVGHGQALFVWVSAAWIPFLWWSFRRFLDSPGFKTIGLVMFFAYLQLTGGYPTMTIFFVYLAAALFVSRIVLVWSKRQERTVLVKYSCLLILGLFIIGLPQIWALWEVKPYVSRLSGLSDRHLYENPFSIPSFISFLYPLATTRYDALFATDLSMRDAFIGGVALLGLIKIPELFKRNELRLLTIIFVVFVLGAIGDVSPFRGWMADFLPGMDLFRMPAYLMYIPLMILIIVCFLGWEKMYRFGVSKYGTHGLLIVHLLFMSLSWWRSEGDLLEGLGFYEVIFWSALSSSILLLVVYFFGKRYAAVIPTVFIVEIVVHALVMDPHTLYHRNKAQDVHAHFAEMPAGFPGIENGIIGESTDRKFERKPGLWRNTGIYQKQLSKDGFSSFWLKEINDTLESGGDLLDQNWISYSGEVQVIDFEPGNVVLVVEGQKQSALVVHQAWFEHWHANVDGKRVPLDRKGAFQKLQLERGKHEIQLEFRHPLMVIFWLTGVLLWILSGLRSLKH